MRARVRVGVCVHNSGSGSDNGSAGVNTCIRNMKPGATGVGPSVSFFYLGDELGLKGFLKLEELLLFLGEGLLTDDGLEGLGFLATGVVGVELVGHGGVVNARRVLADGALHETRERRDDVDGRVDVLVVQHAVDKDLALGDISGQIRNRVRDIIVGHGQNGELGDGTVAAHDATGALVNGRQVGVHVTGVTAATGHFLTGGRDFTQGIGVGRHIGQNDEHVHVALVGEVLGGGQRETRRDDALNRGVVGQVQEEARALHRTVALKIFREEAGGFDVDTHGGKDDGKGLVGFVDDRGAGLDETGLTANLSSDIVVRETGSREEGNLLSTRNREVDVDRRNTRLNHLLRVLALAGVNRLALNL